MAVKDFFAHFSLFSYLVDLPAFLWRRRGHCSDLLRVQTFFQNRLFCFGTQIL